MGFKIIHEEDKCKKCGGCRMLMPDLFEDKGDGSSRCKKIDFSKWQLKRVQELAHVCCGNCIQYLDTETGEVSQIKGHSRIW